MWISCQLWAFGSVLLGIRISFTVFSMWQVILLTKTHDGKETIFWKLFRLPSSTWNQFVSRVTSCPSVSVVIKSNNGILIMIIQLTSRKAPSFHPIYSQGARAYITQNVSAIMQLIGVFHINFVSGSSWQKAWNRRTVTLINKKPWCWIFIVSTTAVAILFTFSTLNIKWYKEVHFNSLLWNRNPHAQK